MLAVQQLFVSVPRRFVTFSGLRPREKITAVQHKRAFHAPSHRLF
jgi:hypothetical protein